MNIIKIDALGACICHFILRIYRNNNAQYNIINSVLPVVHMFQIHTCFIVLRKVSLITLGVFIGQRSSGSISSSVASEKIPVHK